MTRRDFGAFVISTPLMATGALTAQTPKERGKQLRDKIIYALGGDGFRYMRTRTEIGRAYSFYREELSGLSVARIYTKYLPADSAGRIHMLQRQVFGKKLEDAVLFTTDEAYEVTYRGAKPLGDERVKLFREQTLHDVFYILRERVEEPGVEFESLGADVIENQPVETVDIYDAENRSVRVWVNSSTFLPVKQRSYRWDPTIKDRREEVTRYSKYREVGNGVMWPFAIERERDTEKNFQLFSERVTVDDQLEPSMFELPNGIKILKK
ncbi:MAG TPA: hypothetical protein VN519_13200 [Bryobacteraceae bacterium]|nr:hypothetical protein [Bryobacteraceae bacterium]